MNVYQTDFDGVFVCITEADQDPMDESNILLPAGCVETAPPPTTDEQLARWDGVTWEVEDIPALELEPETKPVAKDVAVRNERDMLLAECDWTQAPDAPVNQAAWAAYRQALRDISKQTGFPDAITWPTKPA